MNGVLTSAFLYSVSPPQTHREMPPEDHVRPLKSEEIKRENMEESHECGKSFKQENPLKSRQRSHAGEKPYHCSKFGRSFRHSKTLKAHTCSRMEDGYSIAVVLEPDNSEKADLALVSSPRTRVPSDERRSPSPGVHSNLPPQTHQEWPTEERLKSEEIKQENVEEPVPSKYTGVFTLERSRITALNVGRCLAKIFIP
ncbi:hypothetical protein AOLI_G00319690 [Acnodon oligacanthus]